MRKAWKQATAVAAALAVGLCAGAARADVTVERYLKTGGFMGFGGGETTSVDKISGERRRDAGTMKMGGFLGKMTGEIRNDTITNVPADQLITIDHGNKTYTVAPITPPPMQEGPAGQPEAKAEREEPPKVRVVRNEVTVEETGESKQLAGHDAKRWVVTWIVETEDLETKKRSENTMTMDLWNAPEKGDVKALAEAERDFAKAYMKKIGWDMTDEQARRMGLGMVAMLLGGSESLQSGAKQVAEKLSKIKGYPLATAVKWNIKTTGGAAGAGGGEGQPQGIQDVVKGLGGLMSAFGKKVAKKDEKKDEGGGAVFETYTEIRAIRVGSIPAADFKPPADYKQVAP